MLQQHQVKSASVLAFDKGNHGVLSLSSSLSASVYTQLTSPDRSGHVPRARTSDVLHEWGSSRRWGEAGSEIKKITVLFFFLLNSEGRQNFIIQYA